MSSKLGAGWGGRRAMGGSGTGRTLARGILIGLALALGLGSGPGAGQPLPAGRGGDGGRLERRWNELDRQIRALEELLPAEAEPLKGDAQASPLLPQQQVAPLPPLALQEAASLRERQSQALSLEQTLAIGFANSPTLQTRREEVAAALAELQSQMGTDWPRLSAYAAGGTDQASTSVFSPTGTGTLFAPRNPFFIPPGGRGSLNTKANGVATGLQLRYELLDFARTPKARAALASLRSGRLAYADALRRLQLTLSESYYQLQRAAQRNDIRLRIEQTFFGHEASLARLVAARRGVKASLEAFRDARLRYQAGLISERDLSNTQERLIGSLVQQLEATVNVNVTDAQLLREPLPMRTDPEAPVPSRLQWTP